MRKTWQEGREGGREEGGRRGGGRGEETGTLKSCTCIP